MEKIREVKIDEFDRLMAFLARAYGYKQADWFPKHYGHIYQEGAGKLKNSFIIKDKDRIVSHAGLFPMEVVAGKSIFKAGGIGGVATDPDYRGKGLMGKLLKFVIGKMEREAYAFSVLWGDRQRYGNFGWERGGRTILFTVTERSLASNGIERGDIRRYDGKEEDLKKIMAFHEREKFKVKRSRKAYGLLMKKTGIEVWLGRESYMVLKGEGKFQNAIESGGNASQILSLALALIKEKGIERIRFSRPYERSEINMVLLNASSIWWIETLCSVRIIDFSKTLEGFKKSMQGRGAGTGKLPWPKNEKELIEKMALPDNNLFDFYIWALDHV